MATMKQLNTRIALRSDTHTNWEKNKATKLLKGEIGIEIFDGGKKKIKIGDGTKTWENLDYFGAAAVMTGADAPSKTTLADVGTMYVTDGGLIYVCTANSGTEATWVQLGTAKDANTTYELTSVTNALEGQLNFTASNPHAENSIKFKGGTNIDVSSDDAGNITITSKAAAEDTGATKVTVTGDGVAVNAASYDASSRTMTLTKGFTETPVSVTDASTSQGLVTAIAKGLGSHDIESTKGIQYSTVEPSTSSNNSTLPTSKAVYDFVTKSIGAVSGMDYKGTVGTGGTVTDLPKGDAVKKGDTYKVIKDGTYGGIKAALGDLFIANIDAAASKEGWDLIPSGNDGNVYHENTLTQNQLVVGNKGDDVKTLAGGQEGQVLKMIGGNPTWGTDNDTKIQKAEDNVLGGFETGYSENAKNYAVKMNGTKAYVTVNWEDTKYDPVLNSGATPGLMSVEDKKKLDGLTNYSLPVADTSVLGGIKITQATKSTAGTPVYDIKLDDQTHMPFVVVPWTDTKYTAAKASDLSLSKTEFDITYTKANFTTDLNNDGDLLVLHGGNAEGTWK